MICALFAQMPTSRPMPRQDQARHGVVGLSNLKRLAGTSRQRAGLNTGQSYPMAPAHQGAADHRGDPALNAWARKQGSGAE